MRRALVPVLPAVLLALLMAGLMLAVTGCRPHLGVTSHVTCTPPAGGRCAADVAWPGPIHVSADGRRLHGIILCGGTLHADESASAVTIRLHLGAVGPGAMSCARVDVGVRLSAPLKGREVLDAVSGTTVRVVSDGSRGAGPTLQG
jgi:hypothetical protein